jgi:hypothetical protein
MKRGFEPHLSLSEFGRKVTQRYVHGGNYSLRSASPAELSDFRNVKKLPKLLHGPAWGANGVLRPSCFATKLRLRLLIQCLFVRKRRIYRGGVRECLI